MVLIDRKHLNFLISFHLITIIFLGLYTVYVMNNYDISDRIQLKYFTESIVYIVILIILSNISFVFLIYMRNVRVVSEFNKIIEYSKLHSFSDQHMSIKKLDFIGLKIVELFRRINELSDKRIIKLSSMYGIIEQLSNISKDKFIIINVEGDILHVSTSLIEQLKITDKIILQTLPIYKLIDINLSSLLIKLERERKEVELDLAQITYDDTIFKVKKITAYPVFNFNAKNSLSNIIFII